jgi:hypothetical protein
MRRHVFSIFLTLALAAVPIPVTAFEATTVAASVVGPADVLRSAGFGNVFAAFGESIVFSPRRQGVTDERFLRAWERDVAAAFGSAALNAELAARLGSLELADLAGVAGFLGSPFGLRVAALEHVVQATPADQQIGVLAKGQTLYWRISDTRRAQFDELMHLSGMEVSFAILSETLRAAAVSLHMSQDTGDLEVPWGEIDAGVTEQLSGMHDRLLEATRATFAYTYDSLTDAELEEYLAFLRAPAAQKFYGAATVAVGDIIRRTMLDLGQRIVARLNAVQI